MKVLVGIKRVLDYNIKPHVKNDGTGVDLTNVKMSINPFDEVAVEEAIRLKENGKVTEVIAVSIGSKNSQEVLRTALAMGVDRAIHIQTDESLEPLIIAKILKKIVEAEHPDMIFVGKQAIDNDCNQTGQMLAALLDWGQATFVSKIELLSDKIEVTREVDTGLEIIEVKLPAVVTVDLRLNEPRFVSLPNVMKAKKKTIEEKLATEFGINLQPRLKTLCVEEPAKRKAGIKVATVNELVAKIKDENVF